MSPPVELTPAEREARRRLLSERAHRTRLDPSARHVPVPPAERVAFLHREAELIERRLAELTGRARGSPP